MPAASNKDGLTMDENIMKTGIIYIATNKTNGMCYVGQTTRMLKIRKRGGYNPYFTNALKKYEFDWIEIKIQNECLLDMFERFYIKAKNSIYPNGYNFESGGSKNKIVSDETRLKMSEARKRRKPFTEETKRKISESKKGRKPSDEAKLKMSEAAKNMSEELRLKISESKKGKKHSEETKQKISEALKGNKNLLGHKHTDETKQKISEALKGNKNLLGHKHTDESKLKMSESAKKAEKAEKKKINKLPGAI